MGASDITIQNIWEDGDATEMARFQVNGVNGTQAVVASIIRQIWIVSGSTKTQVGTDDTIVVADSVFDTLQVDGRWNPQVDVTGYNFRDRVPGTKFASGDVTQRVEYLFTGSAGEKFFIVYEHPTQEICGS